MPLNKPQGAASYLGVAPCGLWTVVISLIFNLPVIDGSLLVL